MFYGSVALPIQLQTGLSGQVIELPAFWLVLIVGVIGLLLGFLLRVIQNGTSLDFPVFSDYLATGNGFGSSGREISRTEASTNEVDRSVEGTEQVAELPDSIGTRLDGGDYEGAVRMAYMETRRIIAAETGISLDETHWDFYKAYDNWDDSGMSEELFRLTESYEQAVFGYRDISKEDAVEAVQQAERLVQTLHDTHSPS